MGRLKCLVEYEEDRERFRAKYRIPPTVGMRYVAQREWVDDRKEGEVVIPMITLQCAPNMFRVLGSVEALNERMNLELTHHDVN